MTRGHLPHVDDELLVRRACNELTTAEEAEVSEHLARCEDCREVWRAVESVRRAAVEFDPGAVPLAGDGLARKRAPGRLAWTGLAAAVAASLLAWVMLPSRQPPSAAHAPVVRSVPERVPVPLTPAEGSRVHRRRFSWRGVEGAIGYTVELLDDRGEPIWTSDPLDGLSAPWPPAVEPESGRYLWRVCAHFEDGEEPVASPLISFHLLAD